MNKRIFNSITTITATISNGAVSAALILPLIQLLILLLIIDYGGVWRW